MKKPFFLLFFFGLILTATSVCPLPWNRWPPAPRVALTFDDGPHPVPTLKLSDTLNSYRVPATFFVVGRVAEKYPEILRRLAGQGHEISNHTWSHPDIRFLSRRQMRRELDRTRELIQSVTGLNTTLFRTPGSTESYLRKVFRVPAGYQLVMWNVHSLDQEGISAEQIAQRVVSQVKNGDIVLMHNGLDTTVRSLDIIIPALKKRGFEFVTVSELIQSHPPLNVAGRNSALVRG